MCDLIVNKNWLQNVAISKVFISKKLTKKGKKFLKSLSEKIYKK